MRTLLALLFLCGCAGRAVEPLSLHDPRLPLEARQGLADAEDELVIARARLEDAEAGLAAQRAYAADLEERGKALGAPTVARAFDDLGKARVELARRELIAARAEVALARAWLDRARATTALRHDLAYYDLEPLDEAVDRTTEDVAAAERSVADTRSQVAAAAAAAWTAYGALARSGADTSGLWRTP